MRATTLLLALLLPAALHAVCDGTFIRGDANGDGTVTVDDAYAILWYFSGVPFTLDCKDAADADDSGNLEPLDATTILNYLYKGITLPPPFPGVGIDTSKDWIDNPWSPRGDAFLQVEPWNWTPNVYVNGTRRYHTNVLSPSGIFGQGLGFEWQPVLGRDEWDYKAAWSFNGPSWQYHFSVQNASDCEHPNTGNLFIVQGVPSIDFKEHVNGAWTRNAVKYRIWGDFWFYPYGPCMGPNFECTLNDAQMRVRTLNVIGKFHNTNGPYVAYTKTGVTNAPFDRTYTYHTVSDPCRIAEAPLRVNGLLEEGCFSIAGMGPQTVLDSIEFTFELTFDRFSADPVVIENIYGWLSFEAEFLRDVNPLSCQ